MSTFHSRLRFVAGVAQWQSVSFLHVSAVHLLAEGCGFDPHRRYSEILSFARRAGEQHIGSFAPFAAGSHHWDSSSHSNSFFSTGGRGVVESSKQK